MKVRLIVIVAAGLLGAGVALAQSGPEVAKAKCMGCHEADKKKVGPAMKDIAAKHKGAKDAEAKLVAALKEGKGHMKVSASDAELTAAVQHFLSQK
jgi:cytochrome c